MRETLKLVADGLWVGSTPAELAWFARLREARIIEMERELQRRTRPDGVYLAGAAWIADARAHAR